MVQMVRVCERSDIILFVVDSRNPLFYFSRAMYDYVVNDLHKPLVLVLSKTDLSDPETLDRWEAYLRANLKVAGIVRFSAFCGFHSPAEQEQGVRASSTIEPSKEEQGSEDEGADDDKESDGEEEEEEAEKEQEKEAEHGGVVDTEKLRKGVKRRGHNLNKNPTGREAVLDVIRAIAKNTVASCSRSFISTSSTLRSAPQQKQKTERKRKRRERSSQRSG